MNLLSKIIRGLKRLMPSGNSMEAKTPTAWGQTTNAFFYSLFGTLLPGIIALLILCVFDRLDLVPSLVEKGDFYLYSAGLLSTAIYLLNENKDRLLFIDKIINPIALVCLIFSGIIYGVLYTSINLFNPKILLLNNISVSYDFIRYSSYTFLSAAICIAYRALYIEAKKNIPIVDVRAESRQNVDEIKVMIGSELPNHNDGVDDLMNSLGNE